MINLYVDTGNLLYCIGKRFPGAKLDYIDYINMVEDTFGDIDKMIAYVSKIDDSCDPFINYLKNIGFHVCVQYARRRLIKGNSVWHNNIAARMIVDIMSGYCKNKCTMIIGSNNLDLTPLVRYLGKDVKIFAAGVPKRFEEIGIEIGEELLNGTTSTTQ